MDDIMNIIFGVVTVLLSLLIFALAIYESYIVNTNGGAKPDCWQLWPNTLVNCILNWFCGFIMLCSSLTVFDKAENFGKTVGIALVLGFYHIWSIVIYENITESCEQMYKDDYPELWDAFIFEVGMFIFYFSFVGFFAVLGCCVCCRTIYQYPDEDKTSQTTTNNLNCVSIPDTKIINNDSV